MNVVNAVYIVYMSRQTLCINIVDLSTAFEQTFKSDCLAVSSMPSRNAFAARLSSAIPRLAIEPDVSRHNTVSSGIAYYKYILFSFILYRFLHFTTFVCGTKIMLQICDWLFDWRENWKYSGWNYCHPQDVSLWDDNIFSLFTQ